MALNLASGLQVSAHFFWNRRNAAALSHHGVRMEFDPVQRQRASLILGFIFAILAVALMFLLSWFKPAGQVGHRRSSRTAIPARVFVMVDGRLHPALNLISARLIAGQAANPTFVKANELAKYPQGPSVGIAGAPIDDAASRRGRSQWTICDTACPTTRTPRPSSPPSADRCDRVAGTDAAGRRTPFSPSTTTRHMSSGTATAPDRPVEQGGCPGAGGGFRAPQPVKISTPFSTRCPRPSRRLPRHTRRRSAGAVQPGAGRGGGFGAVGARPANRRRRLLRTAQRRRPAHLALRGVAVTLGQLLRQRAAAWWPRTARPTFPSSTRCRSRTTPPPG